MATLSCSGNSADTFSGSSFTGPFSMGIGQLATTTLKRKFRFLFSITPGCNGQAVNPSFVKSASRPDITIEDTELNFLNETTWIPGKAKWETIEVVYYDAATASEANLFTWLATIYNFTDQGTCCSQGSNPSDWAGTATLAMLDGCGNPIEVWTLNNVFPTSVKFGEVMYDSSDIAEISLTLRYSQVQYQAICPSMSIDPCCSGCTSS